MPTSDPSDGRLDRESKRFQARVRRVIQRLLPRGPTIVDVAADMSLNVRTLQRRLAASGVPFRTLLDECRREHALRDVQSGRLSISDISTRLGYSDPSHFVRAFRRWTGAAPTRYREERGADG